MMSNMAIIDTSLPCSMLYLKLCVLLPSCLLEYETFTAHVASFINYFHFCCGVALGHPCNMGKQPPHYFLYSLLITWSASEYYITVNISIQK